MQGLTSTAGRSQLISWWQKPCGGILKVSTAAMLIEIPPSGPWKGYYLYGHGGVRHRMGLQLTFTPDGRIAGQGIDDIGRFVIDGSFDRATSSASWLKAYIGMHTVQYAGLYCGKTICGDWTLSRMAGGFWIWPAGMDGHESAHGVDEVEQQLGLVAAEAEPLIRT